MICIDPYPGKLTYGRFYEILRKHARGYTIKMDDGSIDRMCKHRFGTQEEFEKIDRKREIFKKAYLNYKLARLNNKP